MQLQAALVAPVAWKSAVEHLVGSTGLVGVPVVSFGNVADEDVERLRRELTAGLADVTVPSLRPEGGVELPRPTESRLVCGFPLVDDGDRAVALFTAVHEAARRVGILVDRRSFRTVLTVAIERRPLPSRAWSDTLTALEAWDVDEVQLLKVRHGGAGRTLEPVHRIPVGPA